MHVSELFFYMLMLISGMKLDQASKIQIHTKPLIYLKKNDKGFTYGLTYEYFRSQTNANKTRNLKSQGLDIHSIV